MKDKDRNPSNDDIHFEMLTLQIKNDDIHFEILTFENYRRLKFIILQLQNNQRHLMIRHATLEF